ncbi:MAG: hypothetical protein QNJ98_15730 [Planctomycetota bacterium]|nr:hypothetical protein [Planctomycetota bacterium]
MALLGALSAGAEEEAGDYVVLPSGERLEGEIVSADAKVVRLRIGTRVYALDRVSLKAVHRAGAAELDPDHLAFVRDVAPRLAHADARLRTAATAALRALGEEARPYLEAVAEATDDARVKEALLALDLRADAGADRAAARAAWTKRFIDGQIEWATANVALKAEQEAGLRKALEAFFQSMRSGTDRTKAVEGFFTSLENVLTKTQIEGIRKAWQSFGN